MMRALTHSKSLHPGLTTTYNNQPTLACALREMVCSSYHLSHRVPEPCSTTTNTKKIKYKSKKHKCKNKNLPGIAGAVHRLLIIFIFFSKLVSGFLPFTHAHSALQCNNQPTRHGGVVLPPCSASITINSNPNTNLILSMPPRPK
jgi:hypothetical protein